MAHQYYERIAGLTSIENFKNVIFAVHLRASVIPGWVLVSIKKSVDPNKLMGKMIT